MIFFCALFFTECKMPMGLSTGVISDSQIKASEHLSKQQPVAGDAYTVQNPAHGARRDNLTMSQLLSLGLCLPQLQRNTSICSSPLVEKEIEQKLKPDSYI